ncbi:MAG: nucleotidyl transferase AbiEii/AbiGii toxin family protein [Nanoarchaeota archaeon]|nr:nucleotidyl transferase AbiEii/AbiGii toxin family protein [Euryarchaeota archaeon]MBU4500998.1 nucleotidyl transferase AbiEii/AbiGii toxin family protein [Nanoarchaeota archaeon]MCG2727274.1 nucleotidyl transferase AbiEii/AbiGii toxin family protein [Candidatus Methanoperedenaceae archaeon]
MRKDFVNAISEALKIERRDLIEKDLILHQMLLDLSKNKFFRENFLFKGGTCLIKCYLGYFRFSEDIDFTWKKQEQFQGMSQKEIRRYLSSVIDETGVVFEKIAEKRGLDFKCIKDNRDYVELGGGNKTATLKIWYSSEILNRKSFFKVQINFVEEMHFLEVRNKLKSPLDKPIKELKVLFPDEYKEYSRQIPLDTYDIKEILCEKIRSILTRRGVKARDFVDVYLVSKKFGIKPEDLKEDVVDKIRFILNLYTRYRDNLAEKEKLLKKKEIFAWGDEKGLLLAAIDEKEFYAFLNDLIIFLQKIAEELESKKRVHP